MFKRIAPILAIVALTLVFFHRLAFTDWILARGDTFSYFYPYWHIRDAALRAGELPLWSPLLFMGVPLLANSQMGTFYPPNWLTVWLTPPDAIRLSILLHIGWALGGVYLLGRRALGLSRRAALLAAAVYAFGGHVGAHIEQINQLQGLAWLPWLFLLFHYALHLPRRALLFTLLLALGFALQFLSGHTQTVFITGVGLVIYGLVAPPPGGGRFARLRFVPVLLLAGVGALLLASPQLIPTLELMSMSNRSGGFNQNEATAFSFSPFVVGRGLLPNYGGELFGEYVAYIGVVGLALALIGALTPPRAGSNTASVAPRRAWVVVGLVGVVLAFGEYNPLYWWLSSLPGFNLFRVPARWLALFGLGAALLAGLGWQRLPHLTIGRRVLSLLAVFAVVGLLAVASTFATQTPELVPISDPTSASFIAWAAALIALVILLLVGWLTRDPRVWRAVSLLALAELFGASLILPYNDLAPPETYHAGRFTINQLRAFEAGSTPPARFLSISGLYFDPGDRVALEARYAALDLSASALRTTFTAIKMKETLAANLPLVWGVPGIDGYDGGLLPTGYYTAFTSLLLPPDSLRTIDGRLRERLALPTCRGACLPDPRWLSLTNTRYLITDKIFDVWHADVAYDTQFEVALDGGESLLLANEAAFEGDAVALLFACPGGCPPPMVQFFADDGSLRPLSPGSPTQLDDRYTLLTFEADTAAQPLLIQIDAPAPQTIYAATLIDRRTGDFVQMTPGAWRRVLSSDIKVYENLSVLPRAFVVHNVQRVADDIWGTEEAVMLMRDPTFNPARAAIIAGELAASAAGSGQATATILSYSDERVLVRVESSAPGYLILTDAYYPGWTAAVNGEPAPLQRANVMFRAVPVPAGSSEVSFTYVPGWLPWSLIVGAAAWLALAAVLVGLNRRRSTKH